jgi:hypothetical protein
MLNNFSGISQQITRKEIQREKNLMAKLEEKKSDLQNKIDERKTFEVYVANLEKAIELMGKFYFLCEFFMLIFN